MAVVLLVAGLVRSPPSAIIEAEFEIGQDQCIAAWSAQAEQLWGWSIVDAIGLPAARLVPARNRERQRHHLEALLTSSPRPTHDSDVTALHRDGREFKVRLNGSVRQSDAGPRVTVRARGLSPGIWAAAAFNATDDRFRRIVAQITDGCSVVDLSGNHLFVNAAYCQLYGLSATDILGTNFREHLSRLCTPEDTTAVHAVHAEVYRTGESRRGFEFNISRGSEVITVEMSVSLERNAHGEPIGFTGMSRDCTRRARAEREAGRARDAAEAANRSKSEFLANMSHEIRTPMNGIIGMTELALGTTLTDVQRDYLQTVHGSAESLLVIINDILDFSKIEAGKLEINDIDFSLRALLDEAVRPLALRAQRQGLELVIDVRPSVPDDLVGDPHRLRQVIVNLLGNAIKFTSAGEIVVRVTSTPAANGRAQLQVHVVDTGMGIPADRHETIFRAFAQADGSTTRRFGGTGLGLTISARLVELMGGRLRVESEPGRGSDFQFDVSLALSAAAVAPLHPASSEGLAGLSALVVDDNRTNLRIVSEMLANWGVTVISASDAAEARAAVDTSTHAFSLVVIDMDLAGTSGIELAAALRSHPRCASAAVLILASTDHQRDERDVAAMANARYVVKPVGHVALLDNVAKVLGARTLPDFLPAAPELTPARAARHLRVLVAEDNVVNAKVAENLLRRRGHEPVVVANGRDAVSAVARERYDLILMDIQMPEMDGLEATAAIRAGERGMGARIPIVALTAHAMEGDRQRCLDADMDGYVSKPIKAVVLFEVIDRVMATADALTRVG